MEYRTAIKVFAVKTWLVQWSVYRGGGVELRGGQQAGLSGLEVRMGR